MFIWQKTWKCMRERNRDLEISLATRRLEIEDLEEELKEAHGVIEGAAYDAARLERDYIMLDTKYKYIREVLENIRSYGMLLQRHHRSIAAALDK